MIILQGKIQKVEISPDGPTVIIGERLDPTGHPCLAEALRKGDRDLIRQEATSQGARSSGYHLLPRRGGHHQWPRKTL